MIRMPDIVGVISIHALTRSATEIKKAALAEERISIHALTRSATFWFREAHSHLLHFNPRTHEECDLTWHRDVSVFCRFQSTHSRGVRPMVHEHGCIGAGISIHALTRSATVDLLVLDDLGAISIHALTRSATRSLAL